VHTLLVTIRAYSIGPAVDLSQGSVVEILHVSKFIQVLLQSKHILENVHKRILRNVGRKDEISFLK
jgi:hypothetical protein